MASKGQEKGNVNFRSLCSLGVNAHLRIESCASSSQAKVCVIRNQGNPEAIGGGPQRDCQARASQGLARSCEGSPRSQAHRTCEGVPLETGARAFQKFLIESKHCPVLRDGVESSLPIDSVRFFQLSKNRGANQYSIAFHQTGD